jgi:hypothetical protein
MVHLGTGERRNNWDNGSSHVLSDLMLSHCYWVVHQWSKIEGDVIFVMKF